MINDISCLFIIYSTYSINKKQFWNTNEGKIPKVLPRFELGSHILKARMLTTVPQDLSVCWHFTHIQLCMIGSQVTEA